MIQDLRIKPNLVHLLLGLVIFLAPTNFFLNISETFAYVTGLRSDYLIIKLFLSEIIMGAVIGYYLLRFTSVKKSLSQLRAHLPLICLIVIVTVLQLLSSLPIIGLATLTSWLVIIACMLIAQRTHFLTSSIFNISLCLTLLFQSTVGILQFFRQSSLFGYYFLGETTLSSFAGVSKQIFFGVEVILPYGTTAHPNILAGYITVYLVMILFSHDFTRSVVKKGMLVLSTICLLLTSSLSAWFSLGIALIYKHLQPLFHKISHIQLFGLTVLMLTVFPLIIHLAATQTQEPSIQRRAYLQLAAVQSLVHQPLGTGLGQFVLYLEEYTQNPEAVRFLQPVHHVPLLAITELGWVGSGALALWILWLFKRKKYNTVRLLYLGLLLALLSPIMSLDHYLWSMVPGRILLVLTISYFLTARFKEVRE